MTRQAIYPIDTGTGQKRLSIYIVGTLLCVILTILSFWTVMSAAFPREISFVIIYSSAIIQFIVQLICFLRLNTATSQGRINVMSLIFTAVILTSIIAGSLWIMWSLGYHMGH